MGILWSNGNIYTMEQEGEKVEAVLTVDGKILATGKKQELINFYKTYISEERDLDGNTMIPGLVDSHMHLIGYGESMLRLDLSNAKSRGAVLEEVISRVNGLEPGEWLIGEGWNENLWEDQTIITKDELDQVAPFNPVVLKRVCRHAMVVNSKALQIAGIKKDTAFNIEGGLIETNSSGNLTGYVKDRAQELINEVLPPYTLERLKRLVKKAIEECYRLGITGVHTEDLNYYGNFQNTYEALRQIIIDEKHYFRAHLLIHHGVIDEWQREGYRYLGGNSFLEFGPMKIFADGSLGGRTALLSKPYADDPTTNGIAIHSYEEFQALVKKARDLGVPIAVHAIGDLAFEWVVDAIEKYPLNVPGVDRLIHAPLLRKDLVERAKTLPVVIDIQPGFLVSDFPWALERIGEQHSIDYLYAWKSLLNNGFHCAGGSDAPIEPANPLIGIHAAVTRMIPSDPKKKVYQANEKLSVYEAVSLYTKGSAYASLNTKDKGMIKPDFVADFTVFDKDIFNIHPDEILQIGVKMTVVDGHIVFEKE